MERKTYYIVISICFWLFLAGCTFNPLSGNNDLTGSGEGMLLGGAIGAGSTALLHAPRPLVVLAGAGGAALGYYVTTLRFDSGGIIQAGGQVFSVGDYVTIEVPSDRLFDTNSADLLPEAEPILHSIATVLQRYPNHNILVSGNTSGFGSRKYELQLSENQARAITAYLWAHGVEGYPTGEDLKRQKLTYVGYGNYFPISNNITAKGIRENSRIQITAYPDTEPFPKKKCNKSKESDDTSVENDKYMYDFNREFPIEDHKPHTDYKGLTTPGTYHAPRHPSFKDEAPTKPSDLKNERTRKRSKTLSQKAKEKPVCLI